MEQIEGIVTEAEREFAKAYPIIAAAIADGTAGPNERWLKQIWLCGFADGVRAGEMHVEVRG